MHQSKRGVELDVSAGGIGCVGGVSEDGYVALAAAWWTCRCPVQFTGTCTRFVVSSFILE